MKVSTRINSIQRQIVAIQDRTLSPEAQAKRLADRAEEAIAEAAAQNRAVLGRPVHYKVTVDGREGAPIASVKPNGRVVANFDLLREVLEWIGDELVKASPRLTGKYSKSHVMEIDGVIWDAIGPMPDGTVFKFFNMTPYARKMEPRKRVISERAFFGDRRKFRKQTKTDQGQSSQAPDGVYAAVAAIARAKYGDVARISYSLRNFDADAGISRPAIIVRML
jgi:hypothetical protein